MGLFSSKKEGGMMDMIRCDEPEYLIWKWRPAGNEANSTRKENAIRWGSSLRVKDGEVAAFVYKQKDGTQQDFIVGPFDETINTANFPILASIIGVMYAGDTPFQAEVYFINLAGNIQLKFGIPFFDVFDPRYIDLGVPTAVRGTITFNIADYKEFIKLNRLINFELEIFKQQIKDAVIRYVKGIVSNVPSDLNIPLVQIERRILDINDWIHQRLKTSLETDFAVNIKRLDISAIELNKESEAFNRLRAVTADIAERQAKTQADINVDTIRAQADINIRNLDDLQKLNTSNMEDQMRIQREELQRAQKLQTESNFFETHKLNIQTDAQRDVLKAAAENLGEMGNVSLGGNGGGMNPAGMMTGMLMGGAMGNQMAGMMNQMGNSMQQNVSGSGGPPPPPTILYFVAVNGQQTGPFNMQQMQQLVTNGQMTPASLVWKNGLQNWVEASQLLDLQQLFGSPTPPPPPIPPTI
jgi:membrane protease subunit (stomatin/prohibitin family)